MKTHAMHRLSAHTVTAGASAPLGATVVDGAVNFSLYSKRAHAIDLLLFDRADAGTPAETIHLTPLGHRSYHYWHVLVPGLRAGQIYGYRAHGPWDPDAGLRFDGSKVLLDPYARAVVVPPGYSRAAAHDPGDNAAAAMKSVVVDSSVYDWGGDVPLRLSAAQTVVYEMHVRGFTRHPSSGLSDSVRGTYAGVVEKIPYLRALGITAVELLPVFQFDALDAPPGHVNYWGYAPVSFFAPHQAYSSRPDPLGAVDEFRDMVKALHRAGIEVILDVVFNHTAEGGEHGPTISLRGLENRSYYLLEGRHARYANYTGCGNTLNGNHPIVRRMIVDSLRYWVREMHVDGFRFDLASILSRDHTGAPVPNPPVLWDIESDPVLAGTKLIAEAWDAAGLYQVGSFIGDAWKEWNGRFRDDVRGFVRGDAHTVGRLADRLLGSPDVYAHKLREAEVSVNFVSCHDGFTLNDLVCYNHKHNEANGEGNRDGAGDNRSWNCGVEGPTTDPGIGALRNRQVKNLLTLTMLSLGMPMILMGDEVRRSQGGNNNVYCQDNETAWFDWTDLDSHADVLRFVQLLIARRVQRTTAIERDRLCLMATLQQATLTWHGVRLGRPDWQPDSHSLALRADMRRAGFSMYLIMNAYSAPLEFELPRLEPWRTWHRWIDTSLAAPDDISPWRKSPPYAGSTYRAAPRSVIVLWTLLGGAGVPLGE